MTHGSLFSGIEGFGFGAEMAGVETVWACEIEKFPREIIKKHNDILRLYGDIRELQKPGYVDVISGGFPCQDISVAGKGEGITGERSGLWREMHRVIGGVRPRYILIENSPMLLRRGFEQVLGGLSKIGYDAEWKCISNADFGFPHLRERLYVIAYPSENRLQGATCQYGEVESIFKQKTSKKVGAYAIAKGIHSLADCEHIRVGNGLPDWTHRIKALGNAVNPYIAKYLFECIKLHHSKVTLNSIEL